MADTGTRIATTTQGRKVHMLFGKRTVCHAMGTAHQIDQILGELGEGVEGTISGLFAAQVAPSRLCGHCFYVTTRSTYTKQWKAAK